MKPLVIIPARGGSKSVPRKNIKNLGGRPLIYYTLDAARAVFDDQLICVTTDDEEIKNVAEKTGLPVPFLRPQELAGDISGMEDVILHALAYYKENGYQADTIVLLQPTSPFRTAKHIREAVKLYHTGLDRVVSVKQTNANPYYVLFEENKEGFLEQSKKGNFKRRQDCPEVWELNGAIYVINVKSFKTRENSGYKKTAKYVMDEKSSVDIDSYLDWKMAEILISKTHEDDHI